MTLSSDHDEELFSTPQVVVLTKQDEPRMWVERLPLSVTVALLALVFLISTYVCWDAMGRVSHQLAIDDDAATLTDHHHHHSTTSHDDDVGSSNGASPESPHKDADDDSVDSAHSDPQHHHSHHHHGGKNKAYSHGMLQRVVESAMTEVHRRRAHGHHHLHRDHHNDEHRTPTT